MKRNLFCLTALALAGAMAAGVTGCSIIGAGGMVDPSSLRAVKMTLSDSTRNPSGVDSVTSVGLEMSYAALFGVDRVELAKSVTADGATSVSVSTFREGQKAGNIWKDAVEVLFGGGIGLAAGGL